MPKIDTIKNAFLLLSVIGSVTAQAEEKANYVEAAFGRLNYEESGYRLTPSVGRIMLGAKVSENVALEALGAIGMGSSTTGIVTLKVNHGFGAYVKPFFPVNEKVDLFGRFGVFNGSLTASAPGVSISTSGSSFSYGAGVSVTVAENISLVADYMSYYDKNSITINGWSVGAKFGF